MLLQIPKDDGIFKTFRAPYNTSGTEVFQELFQILNMSFINSPVSI